MRIGSDAISGTCGVVLGVVTAVQSWQSQIAWGLGILVAALTVYNAWQTARLHRARLAALAALKARSQSIAKDESAKQLVQLQRICSREAGCLKQEAEK